MTRRQAVYALWAGCLIWGTAFPLAKLALATTTPMAFNVARFVVATPFLIPTARQVTRDEWRWGGFLGLLLALGFALQTVGLAHTTASRSGFLTALYAPSTPVIVFLVYRTLPGLAQAGGLALALAGTWLLTGAAAAGQAGLNRGDLLTVASAVVFAAHLVATSAAGRQGRRPEALAAAQILVAGLLSALALPLVEAPAYSFTPLVLAVTLYEAIFASLIAIKLQLSAQQVLSPTHSALIFTAEPVVAAGMSLLLVGEQLGPVQWLGGLGILAGSLLPEVRRLRPRAAA